MRIQKWNYNDAALLHLKTWMWTFNNSSTYRFSISAVLVYCHTAAPPNVNSRADGSAYPRGSGDVQVLHHFFEGGCLFRLFLIMQSDFFAKFARIIRGRHLSLFFSMECYATHGARASWCRHDVHSTCLLMLPLSALAVARVWGRVSFR